MLPQEWFLSRVILITGMMLIACLIIWLVPA
jgi:hypothetical protein